MLPAGQLAELENLRAPFASKMVAWQLAAGIWAMVGHGVCRSKNFQTTPAGHSDSSSNSSNSSS